MNWRALMDVALHEAHAAADAEEAPIGAALFDSSGKLIASAHNGPIALNDPTAHAEVLCLRRAASALNNYRLPGTILAVTLEPCLMCVGAILHARVSGVIFGATDPKRGALVSNLEGHSLSFSNHRLWQVGGIMEKECASVLQQFFRSRRKNR
ncbi:nucleoside deaminase [Desulfovibrio oxyclinae]|uniref:nucleoside deaminase n=1 Tax=Desulfovibrio oxyclinae TaxID=63560 RepID=UPI0012E9A1EB|nr:nucleoside deaminase [Desulfovibrio oxyclinae]